MVWGGGEEVEGFLGGIFSHGKCVNQSIKLNPPPHIFRLLDQPLICCLLKLN